MKHNNVIPNVHFHKKWQERVRTWFDQPGQKKARRLRRLKKAAKIAPRPIAGLLRPAVRCPTIRYNMKIRVGRGFTLEELREAGIRPKEARSIGIAVDHRRRNISVEQFRLNTMRLKEYKTRLILFPRKARNPKKGDSKPTELTQATQLKGDIIPIRQTPKREKGRVITKEELKAPTAFYTLRQARGYARSAGTRAKNRDKGREQTKAA
jgi:large subunit ribosomal protein L13e